MSLFGLFGPPNVDKLKAKGNIKGLIEALRYEKDKLVRQAAAEALGQIGDKQAIEPLVAALQNDEIVVRQAAVEALGRIGDKQAVEPLVVALQNEETAVRRAAAEALGQIGNPQAIEPLIVSLEDKDKKVRRTACLALGQIGDPQAIETLESVKNDSDATLRAAAITAQTMIGDAPVVQLATLLNHANDLQRDTVVEALAKIKNVSATDLISLLENQPLPVMNGVIEALKRLGDIAVEPLISSFNNKTKSLRMRTEIARAMGKIGDQRFVYSLIAALEEKDDKEIFPRRVAVEALGQIGSRNAVPALIKALGDPNALVREAAAWSLGYIGDKRAIEPLKTAIHADLSKDVQMTATVVRLMIEGNSVMRLVHLLEEKNLLKGRVEKALVWIGDAAVEPLIAVVKNKTLSLPSRTTAASVLGGIGDSRAVESLIIWMNDKTESGRTASVKALGQIGDTSAIEALVGALEDQDQNVRRTAAEALGNMGNAAVGPLIAALEYDDIPTRIRAANALGQIGDPRAVGPLVALLKQEDKYLVEGALNTLMSLNWEPTDDIDRAWLACANKDWDELVRLQAASVGPLLRLARLAPEAGATSERVKWGQMGAGSPDIAEKATQALQQVLERDAANIASEDLQAVTLLNKAVKVKYFFEDCGGGAGSWKPGGSEPIDCSQIRQLARQELIRRGLKV